MRLLVYRFGAEDCKLALPPVIAPGSQSRRVLSLSVYHRPQDRFASLARFPASVRITRPAVERGATRADLDSPEPSPIMRAAAHSIDTRRGHAVDHKRPIILGDVDRAADPRERRASPFEGRGNGRRFKHVRSARQAPDRRRQRQPCSRASKQSIPARHLPAPGAATRRGCRQRLKKSINGVDSSIHCHLDFREI